MLITYIIRRLHDLASLSETQQEFVKATKLRGRNQGNENGYNRCNPCCSQHGNQPQLHGEGKTLLSSTTIYPIKQYLLSLLSTNSVLVSPAITLQLEGEKVFKY